MADKRYSILMGSMDKCYVCGSRLNVQKHECMFGSLYRSKSIKYGLVVGLCWEHHQSEIGIHGRDGHELDKWLKQQAQIAFEKQYPNKDFIREFGQNYLN